MIDCGCALDVIDWRYQDTVPSKTPLGWLWRAEHGMLIHDSEPIRWKGQAPFFSGDEVELRLDAGMLTASKLVEQGSPALRPVGEPKAQFLGELASGLEGQYRWCVELGSAGDAVQIARRDGQTARLADSELNAAQAAEEQTTHKTPGGRPRSAFMSAVPLFYGLFVGVAGLLVIAGSAARLGPQNTKLWLYSALASLLLKIFVVEPIQVGLVAYALQLSERCFSNKMAVLDPEAFAAKQAAQEDASKHRVAAQGNKWLQNFRPVDAKAKAQLPTLDIDENEYPANDEFFSKIYSKG
eukprot:COSAG01_NODE_316_length_19004_cov_100.001322_1_plen_297_part_00